MQLGGTNLGFVNQHTLESTLTQLASSGLTVIELGLCAPHIDVQTFDDHACQALRRAFEQSGLVCASVNLAELNLITQNSALGQLVVDQYLRGFEIAEQLGAQAVVVVPGRQHPLRPSPPDIALDLFRARLDVLLRKAQQSGVLLALETVPFGFLQTARELSDFIHETGHPSLRIALDCANMLMVEDPALGVADAAGKIQICHVSDAWRHRWAHTSVGRGEVDFQGFINALSAVGYDGPLIYELMDNEDPAPRLPADVARLNAWIDARRMPQPHDET